MGEAGSPGRRGAVPGCRCLYGSCLCPSPQGFLWARRALAGTGIAGGPSAPPPIPLPNPPSPPSPSSLPQLLSSSPLGGQRWGLSLLLGIPCLAAALLLRPGVCIPGCRQAAG